MTEAISVIEMQEPKLVFMVSVATEQNRHGILAKTNSSGSYFIDNMTVKYRKNARRATITVHLCHISTSGIPLHKV